GIYDEPTANAIREFQMRSLLPMTGKVNKETWDYLVEAYRIVFEDYEQ
ncbi:MAG: peptidoglycan-binding protein, partial [Clostridia bacterium]|nr:peptidoglycan-binding protein [Clostridia bacterium]